MSGFNVKFGGYEVGAGRPCFIIAEAGVNHDGSLDRAMKLVDSAQNAGADAVKFQTFNADRLVTADAEMAAYQKRNTGADISQYEMLKKLELSGDDFREIAAHCYRKKILFLSTPFDEESADLLDEIGVPAFKVSSGDLTNLPLLRHLARKHKPLILSTGMSELKEIEAAVKAVIDAGERRLILLHCVSNYPADPETVNLRAMKTMEREFGLPVGFSDHTEGNDVALAAVALGACVIEKHFTLDSTLPGPDHRASIEPDELAALVRGIRIVERALGDGKKAPAHSEAGTAVAARKSLVAAADMHAGTKLTVGMVAIMRPGGGLPPSMLDTVLDRKIRRDIKKGEMLRMEDLE